MDGTSEMIVQSELGLAARSISPDGKYALVTQTVGEDGDNLYLLDLTTREMTTISEPPVEDRASHTLGGFEWRPDSQGFGFSSNVGREFGALTTYTMATSTLQTIATPDADIENLEVCGEGQNELVIYTENRDGFDTLRIRNGRDGSAGALHASAAA